MNKLSILFFSILSIAVNCSCNKLDIEKGTPKCVENMIKDYDKSSACDDAKVLEYSFQGNTVYTFEPGTCMDDEQTTVINANCDELGYLGGIDGNQIINGENFSSAKFLRTIWEK